MKNFLSIHQNKQIHAIALGKFDGMHLAHQEVLRHLGEYGALLCIEDSKTPLKQSLTPNKSIYTDYPIIYLPFDMIKDLDGLEFIKMIKQTFSHLTRLVVGYDFRFGKNRAYGTEDLRNIFDKEVIIVPEYRLNGIEVHSSNIKEYINNGDIPSANVLLGRYYSLSGNVISGQKLGSKQLYPTINLQVRHFVLPQNGVYASFSKIDKKIYPSVSFIGNRLSTDGAFSIETHILDTNLCVNTDNAEVFFVCKIRDNKTFADLKALKMQISADITTAKEILESTPTPH